MFSNSIQLILDSLVDGAYIIYVSINILWYHKRFMMIFRKELLMTKRTVGRPRRDDLIKQLKFHVDAEEAYAIKKIANATSKSQAEILREIIPIISSKNFEEMIPDIALEQLQLRSEQCWEQLHTPNSIFEVEGLSDNLPAFITFGPNPMIHVKYPTYKICVYDKKRPLELTDCNEIENVLSSTSLKNRPTVYCTQELFCFRSNVFKR